MNGFQLAKEVQKIDPKSKICFITAFEIQDSEFSKIFPNSEVKCFITKPVSKDKLLKHVEAVLELAA